MNTEEKEQFNEILEYLGETLDITETQHNAAVQSYVAVANHLASEDSLLSKYFPQILPQGSFLLGTMIQPINAEDDLDIDLVCQLLGKNKDWTQFSLKKMVGDQLKRSAMYLKLLETPDGRRCWTLKYRNSSNRQQEKYHMDILPAIINDGYNVLLENSMRDLDVKAKYELSFRITDKKRDDYHTETDHLQWLKSNPFGYGRWFFQRASLDTMRSEMVLNYIQPAPKFQKGRLPLQRIIQILKRHRDIMFKGDEDKPISIIITTLAAKAYMKEGNILDGLINVANSMLKYVEEHYSEEHGRVIKYIGNPVNSEENFADKWPETKKKQDNFYEWHAKLLMDLESYGSSIGIGVNKIQEVMALSFGTDLTKNVFEKYGVSTREKRDQGELRMASLTGALGITGNTKVRIHNFEGKLED